MFSTSTNVGIDEFFGHLAKETGNGENFNIQKKIASIYKMRGLIVHTAMCKNTVKFAEMLHRRSTSGNYNCSQLVAHNINEHNQESNLSQLYSHAVQ